jgi:hypothetical protein
MNSLRLRVIAVTCLVAAVGFAMLFFAAKHNPRLTIVAPFCEDPYDAVGSFAFQLAGVAAVLSTLRAFRGYEVGGIPDAQAKLILRGVAVSILAIFVTAVADVVAMVRHRDAWILSSTGKGLALFLCLLVLVAIINVSFVVITAHGVVSRLRARRWTVAAAVTSAGVGILWLYPEMWRQTVAGAILTAIAGMILLFVEVCGLALALLPQELGRYEDLLDDLSYIFLELRTKNRGNGPSVIFGRARVGAVVHWLRAHTWLCLALVAALGGLGLALIEVRGEGLPRAFGNAVLVLSVFFSMEAAGIILGFALFWRIIGLWRTTKEGIAQKPADA